jgi:hypothetical protein
MKSGVWVRIKYVTITAFRSTRHRFAPVRRRRRCGNWRGAEFGDDGIGFDPETMAASRPVSDTNRRQMAQGQVL